MFKFVFVFILWDILCWIFTKQSQQLILFNLKTVRIQIEIIFNSLFAVESLLFLPHPLLLAYKTVLEVRIKYIYIKSKKKFLDINTIKHLRHKNVRQTFRHDMRLTNQLDGESSLVMTRFGTMLETWTLLTTSKCIYILSYQKLRNQNILENIKQFSFL